MQGYAPGPDAALTESRKCFGELESWLVSEEAAGLQHADLGEKVEGRGRELLRQLGPDRLGPTAAPAERRPDVGGGGRIVPPPAGKGRAPALVTGGRGAP